MANCPPRERVAKSGVRMYARFAVAGCLPSTDKHTKRHRQRRNIDVEIWLLSGTGTLVHFESPLFGTSCVVLVVVHRSTFCVLAVAMRLTG